VPASLVLEYFHNSVLAGQLGGFKTLGKIAKSFYWPKMREEIFGFVRQCEMCQWAKPAQDTKVGWHAASPVSEPLARLFIDFMGPRVCSKRGNCAILVVDAFSKFVSFFPVRKMTSQIVFDCLEGGFFQRYGIPQSIVTDNAKVFRCKLVKDLF
jgi:hypothetical protein